MSDVRDNQHWLVAHAARAMTLDVGVVDVAPSWRYGLPAIVAPTMTFEACAAKHAPGGQAR